MLSPVSPSKAPGSFTTSPTTCAPFTIFRMQATLSLGTTYAYPMPILKVRYISTSEMSPAFWIHEKISGGVMGVSNRKP